MAGAFMLERGIALNGIRIIDSRYGAWTDKADADIIAQKYPHLSIVQVNLDDEELFQELVSDKQYKLFLVDVPASLADITGIYDAVVRATDVDEALELLNNDTRGAWETARDKVQPIGTAVAVAPAIIKIHYAD